MSKANSPDFVLQRRYTVGISVRGKQTAMAIHETTPWESGKTPHVTNELHGSEQTKADIPLLLEGRETPHGYLENIAMG